jgi:hypothetical protein
MEACYGGTDVMERSCAVARGIDINKNTGNFVRGYRNAQEPPRFCTSNRRHHFLRKYRGPFCGYLDGPWGLKTCR